MWSRQVLSPNPRLIIALEYEKQAKLLCRKLLNLFSLISKPFEQGQGGQGLPQAIKSSITAVAHYIKIMLAFALEASLTLVFMFKMALTNRNKIIRTQSLYPSFSKPWKFGPTATTLKEITASIRDPTNAGSVFAQLRNLVWYTRGVISPIYDGIGNVSSAIHVVRIWLSRERCGATRNKE